MTVKKLALKKIAGELDGLAIRAGYLVGMVENGELANAVKELNKLVRAYESVEAELIRNGA